VENKTKKIVIRAIKNKPIKSVEKRMEEILSEIEL